MEAGKEADEKEAEEEVKADKEKALVQQRLPQFLAAMTPITTSTSNDHDYHPH